MHLSRHSNQRSYRDSELKAEIISIGTELLLGEIVDTNTQFLANQLPALGIDLYFTSAVGDNPERLLGALQQAWQRSALILTTGGLGPTQDDITREAIAALLGEELAVDRSLKEDIALFFARRGLEMSANNVRQATLIPSATAIPNPQGTAPGWWVEKEGRILVAMPGPPGEMQFMWRNQVLPRLQDRTGAIISSRMLKTFGLSEARVDELIAHLMSSPNPTLGVYAKLDGIYLRITAKAARQKDAAEMIERREADVRKILGDSIWGVDDDTQESVVGRLLTTRGLTLAVAESFTGGFLTQTLANAPEGQDCFRGGIIAASDEAKAALGLEPHLASGKARPETATAMAKLARQKMGASIGIGIEGEGHADTASGMMPGTVFIAIESERMQQHTVQRYSGRLYQMKRRAPYYALFELIKLLRPT